MTANANDAGITRKVYRVVSTNLPADLETPVSAYLKLREIGATFLLESAESVDRLGRYSMIGFASGRELTADAEGATYRSARAEHRRSGDPLDLVGDVLASTTVEDSEGAPHLLGAAVGYVSYDYVRFIENVPARDLDARVVPVCQFLFVETLVVFDHLMRRMTVYSLVERKDHSHPALHAEIVKALENPLRHSSCAGEGRGIAFESDTSASQFRDMVLKAKKHIYDGDCFQIVLSRCLRSEFGEDAFQVYRRLRMGNPSPYMFFLDFGERKVLGSSPEVLVRLNGRRAFTSPIAGTRPRGKSMREDQQHEASLLADEKERAEHTMLVDLARNDLGRVCKYGTIGVDGYMRVERYSHVMHIVSDVAGELRDDCSQFDLFRAAFPAGTVTGAPKVRAMEIIEALEKSPRGVYAGAVGYFTPAGDMDTCIAIRMLSIENGAAYLQAGAGIVADSDPEREFLETESKMAALRVALGKTTEAER
jgi:anthranilate synthase component 1